MATIIIKRKNGSIGCLQKHDVYFMNTYVGTLENGGILEVPVDVGKHTIYFRSKMKKYGKNAVFTAVVNQEDEIVKLQTKFDINGNYAVEYADNSPHIPIINISNNRQHNEASDDKTSHGELHLQPQTASLFCCPKCGSENLVVITEASTKGKDFNPGSAVCGWLLLGPIGLLCGATGKGKQTNSTTYWLCKGCGNKFKT